MKNLVLHADSTLAAATVWLGQQTRRAVEVNESEMTQNRELLTLTRQHADNAGLSTKILVESSRPFVALRQEAPLGVVGDGADGPFSVSIPVHNYGASVAFIETGHHRPTATLARNGDRFALGTPDTVVIPKDTGAVIEFAFVKVWRVGGPVMRPDGGYIALSLDFWFTDASKVTHYMVHAEFDAITNERGEFNGGLRLTNIEFGPPIPIAIDGLDPRSLPQWILDQKANEY